MSNSRGSAGYPVIVGVGQVTNRAQTTDDSLEPVELMAQAARLADDDAGGGLPSHRPGMRGICLLIEAARQLRGQSPSQADGAKLAVAHGNGGMLGSRHAAATIILGRD